MTTLRLKPRTMRVEAGKDKPVPGTLIGGNCPDDKGEAAKAAGAVRAPPASLREYLKATH